VNEEGRSRLDQCAASIFATPAPEICGASTSPCQVRGADISTASDRERGDLYALQGRSMRHSHVHFVVPSGGLSPDRARLDPITTALLSPGMEGNELLTGPPTIMDRLFAACDQSALRLTGKVFRAIGDDSASMQRVYDDLDHSFVRKLSDVDLAAMIAELTRLTAGARASAPDAEITGRGSTR
jgi:hypothetical protein